MTAQDLAALPSPKRKEISRKAVGIPPKGRQRSQDDEVDDNAIFHLLFRKALYLYYAIATFVKIHGICEESDNSRFRITRSSKEKSLPGPTARFRGVGNLFIMITRFLGTF
jgi:hypothetical protein